jgi:hypothetical protein
MPYCTKCGSQHEDDAQYCIKCGSPLVQNGSIEKNIEKVAEKIGQRAEQIGKRIEKKADLVGNYAHHWYDETFSIAGPLFGSFIVLIILRVIIYFIQGSGENIFIVTALGEGLYEYLLLIFASTLLSGYNTYINRKYKEYYQWIYPLISVIAFIFGVWIAAQIMLIISQSNTTPLIEVIGTFINTYLIGIFIIALIIGYAVQFVSSYNIGKEK